MVDESLTAQPRQRTRLWGDVLPLLQGGMAAAGAAGAGAGGPPGEVQVVAGNLECAVTAHQEKEPGKAFNFKLDQANIEVLT